MIFDTYMFSSAGGRSYNEDTAGFLKDDGGAIFVVADGLGGHSFGELASACVKDTVLENWASGDDDRASWLSERAAEANRRILALQDEKNSVLKSTLAVLAIDGVQASLAHTGDSRIYYLHRGWVSGVTEDHSVAYKKFKAGEISRDAIAWDEDQSCLLRALGGKERYEPDVEILEDPVEAGDAFLLCTDGVWEYLRDGEVAIDLLKAENAQQWAELLLLRMMDRISVGNDNLTVVTVMIK